MDYNLQGLSSRSFEQLIQAIAAKVIGPQIVVFGDGPDGGREATFEGSISYPSSAQPWEGYGIVQAKFKQRLQGSEADGNWALKQLRSELESFDSPKNSRRKPQYYIFATNVTLSAVEEVGFKDKFREVFRESWVGRRLKGYDVWDYDKLRVFLDDNEDIRKGYAAWITPGDVLSEVMRWVETKRPDFKQTLTSFLQKELLSDQYVNLEQAGHSKEDKTPIARVFVDLPFFERQVSDPPVEEPNRILPPGIVAEIVQSSCEYFGSEPTGVPVRVNTSESGIRFATEESTGLRIGVRIIGKKNRYVITGGPGQGKTTVSQLICQLFRASILRELPSEQLDPEVRNVLDSIAVQVNKEGLSLPTARRFPIRIVLSQFAKSLAAPERSPKSILSYIVEIINKRTDQAISVRDLRWWLENYPWLIIFDGLDEVPASSNRDAVLEAIRDFRIDANNCHADILTIGTTRPQGYNDDFSPDLHQHVWLAPLSATRAMHYARRLVAVRYGSDQDRVEKVLNRLDRASKSDATVRLMRSPLQVTIMATLVDRMGQPPQERWNLFKEYYKVIYQREVERDIPAAAILRDYQPDVDTIHNQVGLLLQVESERSGQTDARLSREQFEKVVENRLIDEGHTGETFKKLKRQIIEAATDRLVFLVGLQTDKVGFEIRSLQEFMAAEGLMNASDELLRKRLREIAPVSNWRNVFLFAAGKCFAERQHLRDTIQTICAELNEDPSDGPVRETLAGSRLALDLLEDGPARRQPKYTQSLARLALRLMILPPDVDQTRIAALYEPSLDRVFKEEIQEKISHVDLNCRIGVWITLLPLVDTLIPIPWAVSTAERHWPADANAQFDIVASDVFNPSKWLLSRLVDMIPKISPVVVADNSVSWEELSNVPRWLRAAADLISSDFYRDRSTASLNDSGARGVLDIRFLRWWGHDSLEYLMYMPNPSPGWISLISVAKFVHNPSVAELVRALETILDNSDLELRRWLIDRLPWPMASALAFATEFGLDEVKRLAAEGVFGDRSGWAQAELRWLNTGFSPQDILYTGKHLPFDNKIAALGFPFTSRVSLVAGKDPATVLPILLNTYKQIDDPYLRGWIASWILNILSTLKGSNLADGLVPSVEEFRKLINEAAAIGSRIYLEGLELLDFNHQLDEKATEFFNWLGHQNIQIERIRFQRSPLPDLLANSFLSNPSQVGLLRCLSFWSKQKPARGVPKDLLDPDRYEDVLFKEAALIVRLVQGDWTADEIQELARYTAEYLPGPQLWNVLLQENLVGINVPPALYNSFLVELRKHLPSQRWREDLEVLQHLKDSVRRRTSRLKKREIWSELGLPSGLITVL